MAKEIRLECSGCRHKWSEWVDLPMRAEAFIARGKGWNVCPVCGGKKIYMVGGVFMVDDSKEVEGYQ